MNSTDEMSSRVLIVLSTAPAIGTPKCASTIAGMFGSSAATVSPRATPACASALASCLARVWVSPHVRRTSPCTIARRSP